MGLDGNGAHGLFAGYEQWDTWAQREPSQAEQVLTRAPDGVPARCPPSKKLSYREKQEHTAIEQRILAAESELATCHARMEDPAIAADHVQLQKAVDGLKEAERQVERLYTRWAELESKVQGGQ